jgi:ubiquinol-cytochrome c reductase cytochrome b subunit
MKFLKSHPLARIANDFLVDSPLPANINYFFNFGSILGVFLVVQIVTGLLVSFHYVAHIDLAFNSVEHIMRDVNYG